MIRNHLRPLLAAGNALLGCLLLAACGDAEPPREPPGADESGRTDLLEAGSSVLQTNAPLEPMEVYLVGFHPMKEDPAHQMEAHHFCTQVNEDFAQCVLFDGNTRDANLTGIEYIISERLFETLPDAEQAYWHPHNYEILSGQLIAPNLPDVAEHELLESKMNSYGKTWHVWSTHRPGGEGHALPLGEAMLAWSFNRDGEADTSLIASRDERMGINSLEEREARQDLVELARPQVGVDALRDAFPGSTRQIPGVEERE